MATQGIYSIKEAVRGDTARSFMLKFTDSGAPMDLTGTSICMQVRPTEEGKLMLELRSPANGITFIDAAAGEIRIDEIERVTLPAGVYYWDLQITFASGVRATYIKGTWKILNDITRCQ